MTLNVVKRISLIWRILGADIILLLIGIANSAEGSVLAIHLISSCLVLVIFMSIRIFSRRLDMTSDPFDTLMPYCLYRVVNILFSMVTNQFIMIDFFSIVLVGLWIYKFYVQKKQCMGKK